MEVTFHRGVIKERPTINRTPTATYTRFEIWVNPPTPRNPATRAKPARKYTCRAYDARIAAWAEEAPLGYEVVIIGRDDIYSYESTDRETGEVKTRISMHFLVFDILTTLLPPPAPAPVALSTPTTDTTAPITEDPASTQVAP